MPINVLIKNDDPSTAAKNNRQQQYSSYSSYQQHFNNNHNNNINECMILIPDENDTGDDVENFINEQHRRIDAKTRPNPANYFADDDFEFNNNNNTSKIIDFLVNKPKNFGYSINNFSTVTGGETYHHHPGTPDSATSANNNSTSVLLFDHRNFELPTTTTKPDHSGGSNNNCHLLLSEEEKTPIIHLRYLCDQDTENVKALCKDLFPVDYPDYWYNDVASDPSLWSMAAVYQDKIVGICIAEIKRLNKCNIEDRDILSKKFPANSPVCYLLSLGVEKGWRRRGIASLLLDQLLAYIKNSSTYGVNVNSIRALYLHVLVTNAEAISFYERRKFKRHAKHFEYYNIDNNLHDGYTYVLYLNGGHASLSLSGALINCSAMCLKPWKVLWGLLRLIVSRG